MVRLNIPKRRMDKKKKKRKKQTPEIHSPSETLDTRSSIALTRDRNF